ncbi:MAG TPA: NlpC/P60 family protein [Ktedonobacterales bacterium]|nr:NlpC/P60 family protein [Ktedonobacterales bacterium]
MQRPLIPPPFDADAAEYAIATGVVDVHAAPDDASEVVTQALLDTPLVPLDAADGWRAVRLPDYAGWIPDAALAIRAPASEQVAVVTALRTPLYETREAQPPLGEVYATTVLPVLAEAVAGSRLGVALPGGRSGWLDAADCVVRPASKPLPPRTIGEMLVFGRSLLGVPYLWGGGTARGLDCSGLAQLCYRYAGVTIPRDADQQYASIPHVVERGDFRAGDLAFFSRDGRIVHVGVMLDASQMLHADGSVRHQVTVNALDPDREDYSARLAHLYAGARRPHPKVES